MPDVSGLVRIDARVLYQRVHAGPEVGILLRLGNRRQRRSAIEPRIQVSRAGNFKARKSGKRLAVQRLQQLRGNLLGRAAQRARQLEGHRRRVIT